MIDFDFAHEVLRTFALTHNYNKWIVDLLKPWVGNNILEVGCGIGNLTRYLKELGHLSCLDKSEYFIQHMKIDYPELNFYHYDISDTRSCSLNTKHFGTIVCINVLEHVEDDRRALANMFHILEPGGKLLLIVPALKSLFNQMDARLGHYRRYDKSSLAEKLKRTGFIVKKTNYKNFMGMIGWLIRGKFGKNEFPIFSTIMFDKLVPLLKVENFINLPFGMSLFAVATKR